MEVVQHRVARVGTLLACVALCAGALAGCGSSSAASSGPSAPSAQVGTKLDRTLPPPIRSLKLTDGHGDTHTLADFRGKTLVISDTMTLCQETCPIQTSTVVQTARAVDRAGLGDDVEFLSITVDPERDTPRRLAAYRKLFKPTPSNWLTLTGSVSGVHRLWKYLGVYYKRVPSDSPAPKDWMTGKPLTHDVEHSDEVFFIDTHGHNRFVLEGQGSLKDKSAMPKTLHRFMSAEGRKNEQNPPSTAWTVPQALHVIGWLTDHRISS